MDQAALSKRKKKERKKKQIEPLTVESFLNIPLPKSDPPKQKDRRKEEGEKVEIAVETDEHKGVEVECVEVATEHLQVCCCEQI